MSWFKHLSVRTKLFMSFSSLLLLMGIMSAVAVWELACLNHNCLQIGTNWLPATDAANRVNTDAANHRIKERRHMTATTEAGWKEQESQFTKLEKGVAEHLAILDKLCASQEERELLNSIGSAWNDYLKQSAAVQTLTRQGKKEEAEFLMAGGSLDCYNKFTDLMERELELNANGGQGEVAQAAASYSGGRLVVLIAFGVNLLLGLGLAAWVSRWFTHAVLAVDEIANSVATASQELAAASEHLSSGAQQSASSLEETASSLEEITATVRQNADNADQANQLASNSRATAEKGGTVVAQAVTAMGEINQASRKIADIITTIDEIAFQTNLLALNAAVEAARAGEQGRGFAVVAGEVRNLAQRSATAAREIKGLIEDSVHKVETGSDLVNKSGETLEAIVTSVQRVTDIVGEIAAASREQTVGIEQINRAVSQMDQVTQSNASQTEEMSSTAVALSGQAEQLQAVVAQFNLKRQANSPTATATSYAAAPTDTRPVSRAARRKSASNKAKRHAEELELVGAGAGTDGFEEF